MHSHLSARRAWLSAQLLVSITTLGNLPAVASAAYTAITPSMADRTITLTGHDLSIEDIVAVARYGAKVQVSPEAQRREADNYGLLLEATREGIAVYGFNRGAGDQREVVTFQGDALSAENQPTVARRQLQAFQDEARGGFGPEVDREEIVRAMMVVRANEMTYNAPSPQLAQMLTELINHRITPVVQSRGTVGEGDLAQLGDVGGTMIGVGEAYYQGMRVSAAEALRRAGLNPIAPFGADASALISSDAYATGQAALVVYDGERALEWADLIYAMDLDGMNSSITPLSLVVQCDRPGKWLNWDAERVLQMLKGSYLFDADAARIIQDPESLRASSIRQASAWEEWAALKEAVLFAANASDHNPAVHVGVGPGDSWELATPQMMKYYVKGGPESHGQHGYIVSNANWDPYPMANKLENFVIALANMDVAVMLRIDRFSNPFFTVIKAEDLVPDAADEDWGYTPVELQEEIQRLSHPVTPYGAAIVSTVEDLQAQTLIKVQRASRAVSATFDLLGLDLLQAALWLDIRKLQNPAREFGGPPKAAWQALRRQVPLRSSEALPANSAVMRTVDFVHESDPAVFAPLSLPSRSGLVCAPGSPTP